MCWLRGQSFNSKFKLEELKIANLSRYPVRFFQLCALETNSVKIQYKINESSDFNQIYIESRLACADYVVKVQIRNLN